MEITEVRIKLMEDRGERLQAFCSITFDNCFVVRDLKIIEGSSGPFVAMPSRKLTSHCPVCRSKNHLRAQHCNQCGARLPEDRAMKEHDGRAKLYADIAHPINSECREMIQARVIDEFRREKQRAEEPGYISRYDDFESDDYLEEVREVHHDSSIKQGEGEIRRHDEPATLPNAQQSPQGPHKSPSRETSSDRPTDSDSFGEGIL